MPVSSGCFLHYPSCHSNSIARRDKPINVSLSRSGKSCFGARGVCVWGGGGGGRAGYVKIVMTGMCGPNFLAHLSRGLIGELIVYEGIRRPSVRPSVNIFKRHLL